jgi:hypothetical protein
MTPTIACRLDMLDSAQRERQVECRQVIRAATRETRELSDGYAIYLGSDTGAFLKAAEWIVLERRCCSFLNFKLELNDNGNVWLWLTGSEGVKAFIGDTLRADQQDSPSAIDTPPGPEPS